ncbi:MAG TPA: hypothetical protein VHZ03_26270 [Trebonia sp.]|jgi:hypothetical protein|nr:hypothetical protein [Trebonia sp.]
MSLSQGCGTVLATHRLSDFEAAGPAGSPEAAIASNLIASCGTRVCLRQDTAPLAQTREQIGLTDVEYAHIASWSGQHAGRAVGRPAGPPPSWLNSFLTPAGQQLFWTNQRMGVDSRELSNSEGVPAGNLRVVTPDE